MRWLAATITLWLACAAAGAAPAQTLTPIDYHLRVLPNGLRVYSVVDTSRPKVSVQLWYAVGARNDPPGRSGLAHFFEHLMFKGRGDVPAGYLDRLTEATGGDSNASTSRDFTEYHDTIAASQLERVLWAEAARMRRLEVTQADLDSERAVVERELTEAAADGPRGSTVTWETPSVALELPSQLEGPGGSIGDLRRVTLDDVRRFHTLYYRPDNAVLVVAGAFDPAELDQWVDRYFGAVPRPPPATAAPRLQPGAGAASPAKAQPLKPARPAAHPAGREVALILGFPVPAASPADAAALQVIDALLTGDDSALGYSRLVDPGVAGDVFSDVDLRPRTGVFYLGATPPHHRGGGPQLEAGMRALLARLRDSPVDARDLRAAKNQLLSDALESRETVDGVGAEIGQAAVVQGDASRVNSELEALARVDAAAVQRTAQRYLADSRAVPLRLREAAPEPKGGTTVAALPVREAAPAALHAAYDASAVAPVGAEPPATADVAPALAEPALLDRTLPNGMRVIVARSGRVPLATATLIVRGGAGLDTPGHAGLSKLAAGVSLLGCGHSARDVGSDFDALGLSAGSRIDADTSRLSLTGLSASLPTGLRLLARCVEAATPEGLGYQALMRELGDDDDPGRDVDRVADAAFDRLEYGQATHDRARLRMRAPGAVTRAQLVERRRELFRPNGAVLVLTGAVDPPSAYALAAQLFAAWPAQDAPGAAGRRSAAATGGGPLVVDAPGYPLALVAVAARTPGHADRERLAFELADSALGGSFTSRLSEALRGRRSLTYDVGSHIDWGQADGRFSARTEVDPALAPEVAALMLQEIRGLAQSGPGAEELARQKALVAAQLADSTETTSDLADLLAEQAVRREPLADAFDDARRLAGVTAPEVRAAAQRLADPSNAQVVIVADVRRLPASFRRQLPPGALVKADALLDAHR